ncbi:hypothetical protein BGW80DRAFT_1343669, partial [Lactifluus volemus]
MVFEEVLDRGQRGLTAEGKRNAVIGQLGLEPRTIPDDTTLLFFRSPGSPRFTRPQPHFQIERARFGAAAETSDSPCFARVYAGDNRPQ